MDITLKSLVPVIQNQNDCAVQSSNWIFTMIDSFHRTFVECTRWVYLTQKVKNVCCCLNDLLGGRKQSRSYSTILQLRMSYQILMCATELSHRSTSSLLSGFSFSCIQLVTKSIIRVDLVRLAAVILLSLRQDA